MTLQIKRKIKRNIRKIFVFLVIIAGIFGISLMYLSYQHSMKIKDVVIKNLPDKTEYYVGELADYTGLELEVILNNKDSYIVSANECIFSGFDSSKANDSQVIIVLYDDYQCEFDVKIKTKVEFSPILVKVSFKTLPNKLIYKINDLINTTGGVLLCEYHDGSIKEVLLEKKFCYGFNNKTLGNNEITVKYSENGVSVETKYTIKFVE